MKYPASIIQRQFWLLQQFRPKSPAYNVPAYFLIKGDLDAAFLNRSVNDIIRRHEILRTCLYLENGELVQEVMSNHKFEIEEFVLSKRKYSADDEEIRLIVDGKVSLPFDVSKSPLLRATLIRLSRYEHLLLIVMHHTISDLETVALFVSELSENYNALVQNKILPERSNPKQYRGLPCGRTNS